MSSNSNKVIVWLGDVGLYPLSLAQQVQNPALARALEQHTELPVSGRSWQSLFCHFDEMLNTSGPLVFVQDFVSDLPTLSLFRSHERKRAVQKSRAHACKWLWEHAHHCKAAHAVLRVNAKGHVFHQLVLPLSALNSEEQAQLLATQDSDMGPIQLDARSSCTAQLISQSEIKAYAKLMTSFPDDRLMLPLDHPARLSLLDDLAAQKLNLCECKARGGIGWTLPERWHDIALSVLPAHASSI